MYHLRTLGGIDLRRPDGTPMQSVLAQPKRTALLVYLALASPGGFVRRDVLLPLFWPEMDEERARAALRKAIHFLRRSVGDEVLVNRGDEEIGLVEGALRCDALEFEKAAREGRHEEALELFRGELLPGFYVDEAPEFERWLDTERARLRRRATEAAWALAQGREGAEALEWARRAVELEPHDEVGFRRYLALLDAQGDRAGAVRAYEGFSQRLAAEYEAEPSAETRALLEEIRQREQVSDSAPVGLPERPISGLQSRTPSPERSGAVPPGNPVERLSRPLLRRRVALALVALLGAVGALAVRGLGPGAPAAGPVVAVGSIHDYRARSGASDEAQQLADLLATQLAQIEDLQVVSPLRLAELRRRSGNGEDEMQRLVQAARRAGASEVVEGALYRLPGERLRLDLRRIDLETGTVREALAVEASQLVALAEQASARLASRLRRERGTTGEAGPIRSIAVLPLENLSGDPEQEYFADGMTDALIAELARYEELRVISRTSVVQYKDVHKPLPEIARELGVDAVVEGTVLRDGGRVRIIAQLVRAATDEHLWAESYERDLRDVLALQGDIAKAIARKIQVQTVAAGSGERAARGVDPRAYALYLKGRFVWDENKRAHFRDAIRYFEQALAIEPAYAPAYAGLSDIYVHLDDWGMFPYGESRVRAMATARKALELDEGVAEAHTSLAHLLMHEEEWAAAEREYRRAIELNPSYGYARILYAFHLAAQERFGEAIGEARRALEVDPISWRTNYFAGYTLFYARRYDEAIEQWRHMIELHPSYFEADIGISRAYLHKGMHPEGLAWARRAAERTRDPRARVGLAYAHAVMGRGDEALRVLAEVQREFQNAELEALSIAQTYAVLSERDQAFRWLDEALERNHGWMMFLRVDPAYDPLRQDPRFSALLKRMRLQ